MTTTVLERDVSTGIGEDLQRQFQVVLYNDEVNTMDHVVGCLMKVFRHTRAMADKIMDEAHNRGKAIAEVEDREPAVLHKQQLESYGLTASVEEL